MYFLEISHDNIAWIPKGEFVFQGVAIIEYQLLLGVDSTIHGRVKHNGIIVWNS